jgi:hypothetical protein
MPPGLCILESSLLRASLWMSCAGGAPSNDESCSLCTTVIWGCRVCCSALKNFDILEETLSDGRKFLVNNEFSVADISVGYAGQTLKMLGVSGTQV